MKQAMKPVPFRFRVSSVDSAVDIVNSFYSRRFIDFTRFQGAGVKIFAATPTGLGTGTGTRGTGTGTGTRMRNSSEPEPKPEPE